MVKERGERVRFGFFGCGQAGMNHLEILCNTPGAEVVAVCDMRREAAEKAAERFGISRIYTDAARLFDNEEMDAIANVTSTGGHYPLTMMAAEHGIHVFLEKPMSTSSKQAEEMVRTCRKAGIILAVTYTYRFVKETREIKRIIDSGRLGKILEIRYLRYQGNPQKYPEGTENRRQRDNMYSKNGLGIIFDCGIHAIDLLCWYAGAEPTRMEAWGTHHQGYDYPDTATCMMEFPSGIKGIYDYGTLTGVYEHFGQGRAVMFIVINGEKGSIVYSLGVNIADRKNDISYIDILTRNRHTVQRLPIYEKARDVQYKQFMESVRAGKLTGYFPSPEEAARANRIAENMLDLCMKNRVRSPLRR